MLDSVIIEIRAAEGGKDSQLLVEDFTRAYTKSADRRYL